MRALRHLLATVAVLAGLVLAGPAIVSVWVHHDLLDTPRFTATVQPLAADPAVQAAVAGAATRAVDAYLGGPAPDEPGSPPRPSTPRPGSSSPADSSRPCGPRSPPPRTASWSPSCARETVRVR